MLNAMKPQTEEDRKFALKVLRETFPVAYHPPSTKPPAPVSSASTVNHSTGGSIIVASAEECAGSEVAPPIPPEKRRHLTVKGWSYDRPVDASAMVSAALHKLRPRPSSLSDDGDSRCDPSPCASDVHPSDEDCAIDVTFDQPSCPPKPKSTLLTHPQPRQPRDASHASSVVNAATEPAPLAPPGRDTSLDAAAVPPVPSDSPPMNENDVLDDHDTTHDLLMPPAELERVNEFRAL